MIQCQFGPKVFFPYLFIVFIGKCLQQLSLVLRAENKPMKLYWQLKILCTNQEPNKNEKKPCVFIYHIL